MRFERRENIYIDTQYRIIYEDGDILVIDKPAPLAVHPVGCYSELNVHSLLKKDPRWSRCSIKTVHRLDAETSGVLVLAKHSEAADFLSKQFRAGRVKKFYEAVVFGCPAPSRGDIDYPLGYDDSSGFQTVRTWDAVGGEKALTQFEVLSSNGDYARVRLEPLTGRTHQLRAHMAFLGHPIVGDKIYVDLTYFSRYVMDGLDEEMLDRLKLPRLALHAAQISFEHPSTKKQIDFFSEMPVLLKDFVQSQGLSIPDAVR